MCIYLTFNTNGKKTSQIIKSQREIRIRLFDDFGQGKYRAIIPNIKHAQNDYNRSEQRFRFLKRNELKGYG